MPGVEVIIVDPETFQIVPEGSVGKDQGLTLVHFSARRKRFLWDWGCI